MRERAPGLLEQIEAMAALKPLVGTWWGSGWTMTAHGRAEFEQLERVELRLEGELLTVEGRGTAPGDVADVRFRAFAAASYDVALGGYRWRSTSGGNTVEVGLDVTGPGCFSWGFEVSATARMRFDIRIVGATWQEDGYLSTDDGGSWVPSMSMELARRPE